MTRAKNYENIPGGQKKRPKICVIITAHIVHGAKFPLAHL